MARLEDLLRKGASLLDEQVDRFTSLDRPRDPLSCDRIIVSGYRSYGTPRRLRIQGRVLAGTERTPAAGPMRGAQNLRDVFSRFNSREIPGARVRVSFGPHETTMVADSEGYLSGWMELTADQTPGWHSIAMELIEPRSEDCEATPGTTQILVPSSDAEFGIISDLDDTVIATDVRKRVAMLRNVLLNNAHSRLPWDGADIFYRALCAGSDGSRENPIFYVSGGPWNLYDIYDHFLQLNSIPIGPIDLADFGFSSEVFLHPSHEVHKLARIREIFETYPAMEFVMIGDSGEKDAEIYVKAAETYAGRIRMIYIRDVTRLSGHEELERLAAKARELGTEMKLVRSTLEAWQDAAARNLLARG